jgi:hypothetical protein
MRLLPACAPPLSPGTTSLKGLACCPRHHSTAAGAPASPAQTSCLVGCTLASRSCCLGQLAPAPLMTGRGQRLRCPPPPPNSPPGRVQVHGAGGHVGAQRPVSTPLSSTALRASLLQARKAGAGGRLRSQPALSLLALATSKDAPLAWPWERQHSAKRAAVEAAMPCT